MEAAHRAGIPRNPDVNVGDNTGVDYTQVTQRNGRRWSAYDAYLRPARRRPNLKVRSGVHVTRIVLDRGRASGVEYLAGEVAHHVEAKRGVILCAGAVGSPQLLMLSGIGPADHLSAIGVEPVVDLPEVGANLRVHLVAGFVVEVNRRDTLIRGERLPALVRYLVSWTGPLRSNVAEALAFVRSAGGLGWCDLELIFGPAPFLDHGTTEPPGHGYSLGVVLLKPDSSGTIRLRSGSPLDPPAIDPRYLTPGDDLKRLVEGVELCRRILGTDPLAGVVTGLMRPKRWPESTEEIEEGIRRYAETLYHPVGTCRIGIDDGAVVGPDLRVRGTEGLWVADASILPDLNRGHTYAPTLMVAERAAELIQHSEGGSR